MNSFRQYLLVRAFALVTGIMFLNMSFFLAEVSALKISDRSLIANIVKLVSSSGFEEERDGEPVKGDACKEVDLLNPQLLIHQETLFATANKAYHQWENLYPHANYSQTFSPPPDFSIFS